MFGDKSYTGKDITAIREEIIEFIKQNNEDWQDFNESSIQMQYTEMLAGVADMLCYYLDSQALETFLTTARQKKNINSILRMINYNYDVIGSSKGSVTFSRIAHEEDQSTGEPTYLKERYYIPKYLKLWTKDNINFLTTEAVSIPENDLSIVVPIAQGDLIKKLIPVETAAESFKLQVSSGPVPLEYVEIQNEGYQKVDDAFILTKGGPYYSVHYDSYDNVYILFTYDWKKYLPESGNLLITYINTLGADGNVQKDQIVNYESGIVGIDDDPSGIIDLSVTNPLATYGGFSEVDIKIHQANAQNWLRTHDTIVLLSDFETMVRKESWVLDCACFDWRKDDTIVQYPYQLKAWIVSPEGPDLAEEEMTQLADKLQKKTVIMNKVFINNADFYELPISVYIKIEGSNATIKESIRQKVESKVKSWYSWRSFISNDSNSKLKFGLTIGYNKLCYDIAALASAIVDVKLSFEDDITLSKTQFLYCPTVKVELID